MKNFALFIVIIAVLTSCSAPETEQINLDFGLNNEMSLNAIYADTLDWDYVNISTFDEPALCRNWTVRDGERIHYTRIDEDLIVLRSADGAYHLCEYSEGDTSFDPVTVELCDSPIILGRSGNRTLLLHKEILSYSDMKVSLYEDGEKIKSESLYLDNPYGKMHDCFLLVCARTSGDTLSFFTTESNERIVYKDYIIQ